MSNVKGKGQRLIPEDLLKYLEALKNKYPDAVDLVEANPTLEGGEDSLSSVLINGTKYAVGGGSEVHLYVHYINMNSGTGHLNLIIYSSSETPFTNERLYIFLGQNGMNSETNYYSAIGFYDNGKIIMGISRGNDIFRISLESYDLTNQVLIHTSSNVSLSTFEFTDTVKQIF